MAYVAGFFDGEGHVGVSRRGDHDYQVTVSITNTHRDTLHAITEFLNTHGIKSSIYYHQLSSLGTKACYEMAFTNHKDKLAFLTAIQPYAITKAAKIAEAIAFISSKKWLIPFSEPDIILALDAYDNGASLREIERSLGISSRTIRFHAKRLNRTLRSRGVGISAAHARQKAGVFIR